MLPDLFFLSNHTVAGWLYRFLSGHLAREIRCSVSYTPQFAQVKFMLSEQGMRQLIIASNCMARMSPYIIPY